MSKPPFGWEKKPLSIPSPETRAVAFFDGQNLFHHAKEAFGVNYPNFDPLALAQTVCAQKGWKLVQTKFYTGVPDAADNPFWNHFWIAKCGQMGRDGVHVFTRPLRYRNRVVRLPDGSSHSFLDGNEKGIDVRLALDVIAGAYKNEFDVALLFCQDQDLSEVADEIRTIARDRRRWIKVASAYPYSPTVRRTRGINKTDWIQIERATYELCIDKRDYRPKQNVSAKPVT